MANEIHGMMDDIYIERILSGDTESYRYLISKYKDMAYSIAISVIKNEFEAEEIAHLSFIKAFHNLNSFRRNSKYSTWFFRIVINESYKRFNKQRHEIIDYKEIIPEYSYEYIEPIMKLEEDDKKFYINEALKRLPSKECLVLRLFYLEQSNIEEIREMTGWTCSDIKVSLHRARLNLKHVLTQVFKLDNIML